MAIFLKDPAARLDYAVDWSGGSLGAATIVDSGWVIEPDETTGLALSAPLFEPTRTGATLAAGIAGHVYRVANRITLSDGRSDERELCVRVEER